LGIRVLDFEMKLAIWELLWRLGWLVWWWERKWCERWEREREREGYLFGVEKGFLERERDAEKTVDWITVYGSK
jgi:hypothetical protein